MNLEVWFEYSAACSFSHSFIYFYSILFTAQYFKGYMHRVW